MGEPGWRAPVVVVDGRSGSGKTTCASLCAQAMRSAGVSGVQLVHVDALYPGWSGLSAATEMLSALLTGSAMRRVGYWAWDWQRSRPGHWVQLDPFKPLIIEGAGSLCPATAAASDLRIWVDVQSSSARPHPFQSDLRIWVDVEANGNGTQVRRSRALKRDGDTYRPKWQMWAEQEDEHIVRHRPRSLADIVIANPPA
ncbi:MAG: hypothetical protein CSA82_02710 [Actinobacteria bacterium]|nr:MAG: hypothetical protein CSA82_02710 [Actinomycetota bacterium]